MTTLRILLCLPACCLLLSAAGDESKLLPDGPGREAVAKVCFSCHGSGNFRAKRLTKDQWSAKVNDMVERGADGTDAELDQVVDYLAKNFGPDSKVIVNTAPLEEFKFIVGLTAKEAQTVVEYRDAHGPFSSVQDLQKVPGVDVQKIEAKKDLLQF